MVDEAIRVRINNSIIFDYINIIHDMCIAYKKNLNKPEKYDEEYFKIIEEYTDKILKETKKELIEEVIHIFNIYKV